jgi:hypothetical protein
VLELRPTPFAYESNEACGGCKSANAVPTDDEQALLAARACLPSAPHRASRGGLAENEARTGASDVDYAEAGRS